MKKNFLWMSAAILTCGLTITSCSKMDYPTGPEASWEKNTTTIDFEDGTTPFIADSRITTGVGTVDGWDSNVATFKGAGNAQNGYSFAHYDFSDKVEKAKKVIMSFDYYNVNGNRAIVTVGDALVRGNNGGSAKNAYNAKGGAFNIGSDKNNFFINGTNMEGGLGAWCNQWLKVELKFYCFDRKYTYTVSDAEGNVLAESEDKIDYWQADANEATQIDVFGYINNGNNCYIDNLTIEQDVDPSVKYTDAKVVYVDPDGNELKDARVINGVRVGSFVSLVESDKAAIYNADKTVKWMYDTDDAAEVEVAEGAVITVKFKDSGKYNALLNLTYSDGTRIKRVSVNQFVGDNINVYYNIGYKNEADGSWYIVPRTNSSYKDRHVTFTGQAAIELPNGTLREEQTVEYVKQEDIAFAAEFEDTEALTLVGECDTWIGWTDVKYWGEGHGNANDHFDRYSNGQAARLTEGSYFATPALAAGTYKMFIYGRNGSSSVVQTVALYVMDAEGNMTPVDLTKTTIEADAEGNYNMPTMGTGSMGFFQIGGIVIPEGGKLVIKNDGQATYLDLDFIALSLNADADLDALTN
ncbi:MAG: hypothetical protein K2M96_08405 [Prevotella sp.]|nr:hypothetical protein [Prevotella sp.]